MDFHSFLLEFGFWSCLLGFCVFLSGRWQGTPFFIELVGDFLFGFRRFLFERRQGNCLLLWSRGVNLFVSRRACAIFGQVQTQPHPS